MLKQIIKILETTPGLMAKEIAREIGSTKKQINPFLYSHEDKFTQDDKYRWFLINPDLLEIEFCDDWVDSDSFEEVLKQVGSPLDSECSNITFKIPKGCKLLLEATARLLALCNQLDFNDKHVTINFADKQTLSYLNRVGFVDHLREDVVVLPARPKESAASKFKGKSSAVVEFGEIDINSPNKEIPRQLKESFADHTRDEYASPVFTVLSELFGNVSEHSEASMPGFTALQLYKNSRVPHIQIVISDSGKGIVGTLRPVLEEKYSNLAKKFDLSNPMSDVLLVLEVFKKGRISQYGSDDGRGLGLKRSSDVAAKFNANISIRQENFELRLIYLEGKFSKYLYKLNMPVIKGTHICFDFLLD